MSQNSSKGHWYTPPILTKLLCTILGLWFVAFLFNGVRNNRYAAENESAYYFWTPSESTEADIKSCQQLREEDRTCAHNWCLKRKQADGTYAEIREIEDQLADWGASGWMRYEVVGRNAGARSCVRHGYVWRVIDVDGHFEKRAGADLGVELMIAKMLAVKFGRKISLDCVWVQRNEVHNKVMWEVGEDKN